MSDILKRGKETCKQDLYIKTKKPYVYEAFPIYVPTWPSRQVYVQS